MENSKLEILLEQIEKINYWLKLYDVSDALIFGSRAKGTEKESSDLDIAVYIPNYHVYSEFLNNQMSDKGFETKHYAQMIIDEMAKELGDALTLDISIDIQLDKEEFYDNSIYQNSVLIRKNNRKISKNNIKKNLESLQERYISFNEIEAPQTHLQKEFYVDAVLTKYLDIFRYESDIVTFDDFIQSYDHANITMRNKILNNVARLALELDKMDQVKVEEFGLPKQELIEIYIIVKKLQRTNQNFNKMHLGWHLCNTRDLSNDELRLLSEYYKNHLPYFKQLFQERLIKSRHSGFQNNLRLLNNSKTDRDSFLEVLVREYDEIYFAESPGFWLRNIEIMKDSLF